MIGVYKIIYNPFLSFIIIIKKLKTKNQKSMPQITSIQNMSVEARQFKPVGNMSAAPKITRAEYKAFNWSQKCKFLHSFNT